MTTQTDSDFGKNRLFARKKKQGLFTKIVSTILGGVIGIIVLSFLALVALLIGALVLIAAVLLSPIALVFLLLVGLYKMFRWGIGA